MADQGYFSTLGLTPHDFLVGGSFLVSLTGLLVIIRAATDWNRAHKIYLDDYFAIAATVNLAVEFALSYIFLEATNKPMLDWLYVIRVTISINVFLDLLLWSCKVPLILLYIRMFGVKAWLRITCYTVLVVSFLPAVAGIIANLVQCAPDPGNTVTPTIVSECGYMAGTFNIVMGFISIFVDAILFVLPIPIIKALQMPLRRRIAVGAVFLTGVLAIIASTTALYFKFYQHDADAGDTTTITILATILECSVAIMVSCAPSMSSFWSHSLLRSGFYSLLHSVTSWQPRSRKSSTSNTVRHDASSSEFGPSPYVVIDGGESAKPIYRASGSESEAIAMRSLRDHP